MPLNRKNLQRLIDVCGGTLRGFEKETMKYRGRRVGYMTLGRILDGADATDSTIDQFYKVAERKGLDLEFYSPPGRRR